MNKIRTVLNIALLLVMTTSVIAQKTAPNGKLSLKQSIEIGINNNLDVQQSNLLMERSRIDWNQARLNLLPSLNGNVGTSINQGRNIDQATNTYINNKATYGNYGLNGDVVLFNGLAMQNAVKQNALAYEASKMDWQQAKDNLTIRIILAYLQVLSNEDLLNQNRSQASLSKSQVDRLEILNKEGAIAPSQLTDLQGQYGGDQLAIINTENALESAKISLCQLMNVPYDKTMQLERINAESYATKYEQTPDSIYQVALQQFAQVKAADLRTLSSQKSVKVARGQLYPTLSLGGFVGTNYASTFSNIPYGKQLNNNRSSAFSLNLRIPIFNSLQQRNRIEVAKLNLKNNELSAKTTKTQLQQSIEQAYINMTSALDRYKVLLDQVKAYAESYRAAEIRFNAGLGTSVDYLTAKNNLDRSNINVIMEKYNYILRTKILDYYQGKQLW